MDENATFPYHATLGDLHSVAVEDVTAIKGIPYPAGVRFRQIIVTGPPGSGKTMLVQKLGGWPEEGYLDLGHKRWWNSPVLNFRPREVHLGLPFAGDKESHAVFDKDWLLTPRSLEPERIQIPPEKRGFWSTDWRRKYVFDFQLLPAEHIYEIRQARAGRGSHPVDVDLTLSRVERQIAVYQAVARHLHGCGVQVFFRDTFEGPPQYFI